MLDESTVFFLFYPATAVKGREGDDGCLDLNIYHLLMIVSCSVSMSCIRSAIPFDVQLRVVVPRLIFCRFLREYPDCISGFAASA
jgi:hypothetical protein